MQSIKLNFQVSHSLAELFTYTLSALGAEGVTTVDREELAGLYDGRPALNYAMDDYLASLPEEARVEAYFKPAQPWAQVAENNQVLVDLDRDYQAELYEPEHTQPLSLKALLALLEDKVQIFQENLGGSCSFEGAEIIEDEDWDHQWQEFYQPLRLSRRLTVCPSWLSYEPDPEEMVLKIDPGRAFGTGYHESTELCLKALDDLAYDQPAFFQEARTLDLGTGSGILAIALAKLGARHIEAVDIDPDAVTVAQENFQGNQVADRIQAATGELNQLKGPYHILVANLIAKLHIDLAEAYPHYLAPGGYLILSGIIDEQFPKVRQAFAQTDLVLEEARLKHDWWTLIFRKLDA